MIILTTFIVGIVTAGFVEDHLKKDASEIVIDEIVAFWLILFLPRYRMRVYSRRKVLMTAIYLFKYKHL